MPRPDKVAAVAEIKERLESAQAVFLAEYAGLSVKAQQELRRGLRESGAEFKVLKMSLTRRAAADLDIDELDDLLTGPTGLAFADGDPVAAAKVLKDFASDNEVFAVKGGLLGRDPLTPERISELAEIEPREVLLALLAGAMKAPMSSLAGLLSALPRDAASVFGQLLEKKEAGEAPAPADTAPPEAPPEEEAPEEEAPPEEPGGDGETPVEQTGTDAADVDQDGTAAPDADEAPAPDDSATDDAADTADADADDADTAPAAGDDDTTTDDPADVAEEE